MDQQAVQHLLQSDRVLRRIVNKVGDCQLVPQRRRTPFESLATAIAHQQLNGTAANTILNRFRGLFPGVRFPAPADLDRVTDEQLRGVGFSRAKVAAIRDLAAKSLDGTVPPNRQLSRMEDEEIVERLTQVRGIGRWTVEMLLIFQLGRPDILPADDFGIRNGFRLAFRLDELPGRKQLLERGERWRPFRTTAAWYLWRAVDLLAQLPSRK
ncbi:MAG: DNA-3-methyladenine glycosylase 2 family protein [Planctomycetes bacterium]|nr:DNA-3-methyladenine glycosylase 2 family protein [Planctomycetota bacterium]